MRVRAVVALVVSAIALCACGSSHGPDVSNARCWNIPAQYGGGTYCSDELEGGDHGYVNPGSMEWEVE